jgi:sialic acid synthase SpsE
MNCLRINGQLVGCGQPTFVIAEIGVNHDGRLDRALELVEQASRAGANAVKLQIFSATTLMHPSSSFAEYQKQGTTSANPVEMLREFELSRDELNEVVAAVHAHGMLPLATPFSPEDVEVIESLNLPAIKIASPDLVNQLLLARAAGIGRPMLLSTGAATIDEIEETTAWLCQWNVRFALMHCVSSYPTPSSEAQLSWIRQLARFDVPVGYSDHTTDIIAGALSVAAGACIIEKHLTYDRTANGPDHSASADPQQFAEYVRLIRNAEAMCGSGTKHVLPIERDVRKVSRQSLVVIRDIAGGERIKIGDLTVQRPGTGIPPADVSVAVGRVARQSLQKGTMLQWDMLVDAA